MSNCDADELEDKVMLLLKGGWRQVAVMSRTKL